MHTTLETFFFGARFRNWAKIMYTQPTSKVSNKGFFKEFGEIHRGITQDCPLSAYLFILVIEVLALKIKQKENIREIEGGYN